MMAGNYLPGVLGLISEELGKELAVDFAKAFGGREIYIPKVVKPDCVLAKKLGQENAVMIAKLFGSGDLLVPCGDVAGAAGRKARIAELYLEGMSQSQIAAHLGVHIKTVSRATARLRNEEQPFLKL